MPDSSDDEHDEAFNAAAADRAKAAGNKAFTEGNFKLAVKQFGIGIKLTPNNHVLYSNRSGAHASLGNGQDALMDANKCIELNSSWAKGYGRKGAALILLGKYKEAIKVYKAGLEIEPGNAGLQKGLDDLRESLKQGEVPDGTDGAAAATAAAPAAPAAKPTKQSKEEEAAAAARANMKPPEQWIDCAKRGDKAAMEALLAADASLLSHKARGIGHTAMHWAAAGGDKNLMQWLLSMKADVNCRNNSEATPLHTAASSGQAYSVEWLLTRGADGSLVNDDGNTAADMAKKKNRPDLATTIEKAVTNPPPQVVDISDAAGTKKEDQHAKNTADMAAMFAAHEEEVD